jgi:ABC-type sugar transport system ATPase subunit/ribose/xylose/arabinose/galactoside ABC-type transport system permease subunit
MNAVVELAHIGKTFPGVVALAGVDLTLHPGRIHALVGENGAGKSTLLNILSGVIPPDSGAIHIGGHPVHLADPRAARRLGIVAVHQEVDLFGDLTVLENVGLEQGLPSNALGWIDWTEQRRRTAAALHAVGRPVGPDALAERLTPAQRQLVEIAAAVSQSARVLILDEPTSSLSAAEARVLFDHLRRFRAAGTAILYVSHRLEDVFSLADEVTVLRDGRRVWSGPIDATSPGQLIRHMVGRDVPAGARAEAKELGPVRLRCVGLSGADGSFHDVTVEVRGGEVLGLYGLIGAGRSEWAQGVFGLRPLAGGAVYVDGAEVWPTGPGAMARAGLAYVPEDRLRQGLCRGLGVRANTVLAALRRLAPALWLPRWREVAQTRAAVRGLGIRLHGLEQPAGTLSGGNQQKVVLGRWLGCAPRVLILDEPTRGVDVGAKEEIYALVRRLSAEGRAVVFISSELPEVVAQGDRVGVFRDGRLVAFFDPRTNSAEDIAAAALPASHGSAWGRLPRPLEDRPHQGRALRLRESALLGFVLVFFVTLHVVTGRFLQPDSLRGLLTEAALLSFCAVGATLVILAGGLDISLGALMALSAGVAGVLWEAGWPWPVVTAVALGIGAAGGALNAGLALVGGVHPIVVTLGTMSVYRGLTLWWLGRDVQISGLERDWLVAEVLGLPVVVWLGAGLLLSAWAVLRGTVAGRHLYALGSNPAAAHRVSISRTRVWLGAFAVQGLLVGLAGLLYLARSGSLQPTSHEGRTLEAIAAAVVGGVAITGGRGSVWGVALGCVFLMSLGPACLFLGLSTRWQQALVGSVMVAAVLLDSVWRGRSA